MKKTVYRVIAVGMVLAWMMLIFGFSAHTGEESGGLSAILSEPITSLIAAWLKTDATDAMYRQVDSAIRMAAHFSEYAVLGGLLLIAFRQFGLMMRWLPWLIGALYAVLDEWHQSYIPGRVCDPADVLLDASGVLCGILLTQFLTKTWRKKYVYHS